MLDFFAPFFFISLVFLAVVLIITYVKTIKLFPLVYVLFAFTYIVTMVYWIDEFDLGRNAIIGLLVLSSLCMILAGKRFTKKPAKTRSFLRYLYVCAGALVFLAALGMINIGLDIERSIVESISSDDLYRSCDVAGVPVSLSIGNVTASNGFIVPRKVPLDRYVLCSDDSLGRYYSFEVRDEITRTRDFEVAPFSTRTFYLSTTSLCRPALKEPGFEEGSDRSAVLYLIERDDVPNGCYDLTDEQFRDAITIRVE